MNELNKCYIEYGVSRKRETSRTEVGLARVMERPLGIGFLAFEKFLKHATTEKQSVLLVLNDAERAVKPTHAMLDAILPSIIKDCIEFKIAIATGTHNNPSETDQKKIFGQWWDAVKNKTIVTNEKGTNPDQFVTIPEAKTHLGHAIHVNRILLEPDQVIIALNSVEPHPRAGLTGGWKSIWPGLGPADDIKTNHAMTIYDGLQANVVYGKKYNIDIRPTEIINNPLRREFEEIGYSLNHLRKSRGLLPIHSLNVVMDAGGETIIGAAWGNPHNVLHNLLPLVKAEYSFEASKPAKRVILEVPDPQGQTLEQCFKGLTTAEQLLMSGGDVIIRASLTKGLGSDHFVRILRDQNLESLQTILKQRRVDPSSITGGEHILPIVIKLLQKTGNHRITVIPDNSEQAKKFNESVKDYPIIQIADSLDEAVHAGNNTIAIVHNATTVLPQKKFIRRTNANVT